MASDDLRDRIRRGDLDAFTDPTLPVYLLGELDAPWWREGVAKVLDRLNVVVVRASVACGLMPGGPFGNSLIMRSQRGLVEQLIIHAEACEQEGQPMHKSLAALYAIRSYASHLT